MSTLVTSTTPAPTTRARRRARALRALVVTAATTALVASGAAPAGAARGDLDTSFGDGGTVVTAGPAAGGWSGWSAGLARQGVGTVVVSLRTPRDPRTDPAPGDADVLVRRLGRTGRFDATFGDRGATVAGFGAPVSGASAVVQPDGRILVLAVVGANGTQNRAGLVRLLPGGAVDPSFGGGRPVLSDVGAPALTDPFDQDPVLPVDVLPTADGGALVAVDERRRGSAGESDVVLAKFDAAGRPDAAFGPGGLRRVDLGGDDHPVALLAGPAGEVLLAAWTLDAAGQGSVVARLRADGSLDPAFGDGGAARVEVPGTDLLAHGAVLAGGGVVLAGTAFLRGQPGHRAFVARVALEGAAAGRQDPGFGDGGALVLDDPGADYEAAGAAAGAGGGLLVARALGDGPWFTRLERRDPRTGALDARFGSGGSADLGEFQLTGLVADRDGVVVSGLRADAWAPTAVVRRYLDEGPRAPRGTRVPRPPRTAG